MQGIIEFWFCITILQFSLRFYFPIFEICQFLLKMNGYTVSLMQNISDYHNIIFDFQL